MGDLFGKSAASRGQCLFAKEVVCSQGSWDKFVGCRNALELRESNYVDWRLATGDCSGTGAEQEPGVAVS